VEKERDLTGQQQPRQEKVARSRSSRAWLSAAAPAVFEHVKPIRGHPGCRTTPGISFPLYRCFAKKKILHVKPSAFINVQLDFVIHRRSNYKIHRSTL
jgi:hypothetical protein